MVQNGLQTENGWFGTVRATAISGTNILISGGNIAQAGSPYSTGIVYNFTARGNVSGGMFVAMSGGLAFAAPASTPSPIGIALATTASGATVPVLVRGIYPVICEGTLATGVGCQMGAGAGLNTVGVGVNTSGTRVFPTLSSAASGTSSTVFILL